MRVEPATEHRSRAVELLPAFFFFLIYLFYLFLAVLGLRFCARAFPSCGKQGPLFIAARGPLTIAASLVAEHRLQMRRLSHCGSRAQPLRGTWDPPRPGLEPVSPALAGRLPTTAPRGKPLPAYFVAEKSHLCSSRREWPCGAQRTRFAGRCLLDPKIVT